MKSYLKSSLLILTIFTLSPVHSLSDLDTLLNLKSSLIGPSGSGLHDWTSSSSSSPAAHCSFSGITCNSDSQVISLNITGIPLLGTLSPEIALLTSLINLTLAGNNLTGNLPTEFSGLTKLKQLNLTGNFLNGTFPCEITLTLPDLDTIDLYNNELSGEIPTCFARLKKLQHLDLSGNYFSGVIPEIYSEFECLIYLALDGNCLTGAIPVSLTNLPNLEVLYLGYYNSYSGGIPPEFGVMKTLRLLNLGECNLTGEIPASLGNLTNLDSLFLQFNHLTGHVPVELSNLVNLMSLDISCNDLIGEIPSGFKQLKKLTLINLFENRFEGPFPSFIGDLPDLEVLQMWENNFTLELPENLGKNGRLIRVDVANNHLTGLIPKELCKGGKLRILILLGNFLYGSIPENLGECISLTRIRMGSNFLNGTVPGGFFRLPSLEMLELRDNYLTGELPEKMESSHLSSVILSNNWISGGIPVSISDLSNLTILSLDMNRFTGEIPVQIFRLQNLAKVNISDNGLTGEIPTDILANSHLTFIDLSRNNLNGVIPRSISKLLNLNVLNLSRNHLHGSIPEEIGLMKGLTSFDLSYNNLSGRKPITGLFSDIDDRFLTGNPLLCLPHNTFCESDSSPSASHNRKILIAVVSAIIALLLSLLGTWFILKRKRLKESRTWKLTAFQKLEFRVEDVLSSLRDENVIGRGGAGIVYRGSMPNGINVAIKRLTAPGNSRNDHGFTAEVKTLGGIKHRNIVKLLGYVSNKETNLLLYEYMSRGSLGEMLRGEKGNPLPWERRYQIAVDAAKGMCYLHHDCSPSIIHRDVKSNNILLNDDCEAHVADFGLAKFWHDGGSSSESMSSVAGSYGYIAPEYAYTLRVDLKSDVYSFGVVLLELITGRKPVGEFGDGVDLVRWVRKTTSEHLETGNKAASVVDTRLDGCSVEAVADLFRIAMMCVEDERSARPTMREVVYMLTSTPSESCSGIIHE